MKKIRLNADDLEVLSFTTARTSGDHGTVRAAGTGNPCYNTVAYHETRCLGYPASYWGEETCDCPFVPYTQDLRCGPRLSDGGTCITCPPEPGC